MKFSKNKIVPPPPRPKIDSNKYPNYWRNPKFCYSPH